MNDNEGTFHYISPEHPPRRCEVLRALMQGKNPYAQDVPHTVAERAIEDLEAVGLVSKVNQEATLSALAVRLLMGAKPNGLNVVSPQFLYESGKGKERTYDGTP